VLGKCTGRRGDGDEQAARMIQSTGAAWVSSGGAGLSLDEKMLGQSQYGGC
jgi:hypothetical protein